LPLTLRLAQGAGQGRAARIHTGIGVSDIHIMGKFRDDVWQDAGRKEAKLVGWRWMP